MLTCRWFLFSVCTAFCSGRGFEYAGIEYGRECWCGAGFSNGGTGAIIACKPVFIDNLAWINVR